LTLLAALVDKSLVRHDRAEPRSIAARAAPHAAVDSRFVLLEPIREYALEQLVARGEAEALQHAHASYYRALAEAVAAQWDSPTANTAIQQLDRDHDNLRAALQWACDGGDYTVGLQLAGALRKFWQSRGLISEGRTWLEELLGRANMAPDPARIVARLNATQAAAWLASNQHDFAHAAQHFEQSIALQRALGETAGETQLLFNAALQARALGQYERATLLLEDAVAQQRARGDRASLSAGGLGLVLYGLGLMFREQGEFARAAMLFEECIDLHRALGDREGTAQSLLALGDIARDQGNVALTRTYSEQSLGVFRELGVQWAIGFALNNLALAASLEGELALAFTLCRAVLLTASSVRIPPLGAQASLLGTRRHDVRAPSPPAPQRDSAGVIATSFADQGQYRSDVITRFSTSEGRPSQTSVAVSVNSTESGSMCQEYPTLTSGSPRTTRPFGMRGADSPARSFCAIPISSGSVKRRRYSSASATRTVTTIPPGCGAGCPEGAMPPQPTSMADSQSARMKVPNP
jgi:tetratricopeptide (TPR) repeat protein